MLSFLSSNKRSRRVAGKLYKNFRGKQNKGYKLAMEKQPIPRNNHPDNSTIAPRTRRDKASLHREILLEMCLRQRFERSLENKISRQRESSEFETIRTWIQLVDVIRFHSNAIRSWHRWFSSDMPCKWHQRYHPKSKETSLRYKQFGKGIVKHNAFKQNFTLFCSTSEPKGVSFTLWIFRWRLFDRRDVLYALGNDKVEIDQPPEAANMLY